MRVEIAILVKKKEKKRKRGKYDGLNIHVEIAYMYIRAFYVLAVIVTIHLRAANDSRASVKRCRREREYGFVDQT